MSQVATGVRLALVPLLAISLAIPAWAQLPRLATASVPGSNAIGSNITSLTPSGLSWRRLGLPSFEMQLAGAATGPAEAVWYSDDGGKLFLRTAAGTVFESADFETWTRSDAAPRGGTQPADVVRLPEPQARAVWASGDGRRQWALGRGLSMSEDGGRTWTNLVSDGNAMGSSSAGAPSSIIGEGQRDLAVDPSDSSAFAVANDEGVWQSRDGGKTWAGLNEKLPNLPVARILSTARGAYKIALRDGRTLQLGDARSPWKVAAAESALAAELADRQKTAKALGSQIAGSEITAFARSGELAYAGSSDGRVWVSRDRGATWSPSQTVGRGNVERIFVDPDVSRAALAVISGAGAHVVRTVNAGAVWDDVTGNLGDVAVLAATADLASSMAYVATDKGVFAAHVDLNVFTPASAWIPLAGPLPAARGVDIALDAKAGRLVVALEGYGLYAAQAPVRGGPLRIVNAADFSNRPAAPGSVISVIGGKVATAQAGTLRFPVLAAGDTESQLQVPFETRAASVDLAIAAASGRVTIPLVVQSVSPAIFVDHDGAPFLVDAGSGLALDAGAATHPRQVLRMMATGLGRVQPDWPTGVPAPDAERSPAVVANVQAFLDGMPIEVTRATLAPGYIGYYEIEVQLPSIVNAGSAELYLLVDGQESNRVRVAVEQ